MPEGFNLIRHNRDGFANLCRVCARAAQAEARGCMSPVLEPTVERKARQEQCMTAAIGLHTRQSVTCVHVRSGRTG